MDQSSEVQNSMESSGSKSSTSAGTSVSSPGSLNTLLNTLLNTTTPTQRLSLSRKAGLVMPVMKIHLKLQQTLIARKIRKSR